MRILLHSYAFPPAVGGVETIGVTLATQLTHLGHDVTVVTETPDDGSYRRFPFAVVRNPSARTRFVLSRRADVIHSNGASLAMYPYAKLTRTPFMWTHNGYQVQSIDGLGWADGQTTPLAPAASIRHVLRTRGIAAAASGAIKLAARRWAAAHCHLNVACTEWVFGRLSTPRKVVAYTPYDLSPFRESHACEEPEYEFIYVGRLVSEKGIPDMLAAFASLQADPLFSSTRLAIVGDGPMRDEVRRAIETSGLTQKVIMLGRKTGPDLIAAMKSARIGIVPSRWQEPMGGVALELLASGRMLITSSDGGHAECVRDVALTFPNGDHAALADCMRRALTDKSFQQNHCQRQSDVLMRFDEQRLTEQYVTLYESLVNRQMPVST